MKPFSTSFALASAIGVNTHANYAAYQNVPLVASKMASLGISRIRDGLHWWPNADAFSVLCNFFITLRNLGVSVDAVVDPSEQLGPMNAGLLNQFCWGYGSSVISFEGQNEPDNGTPQSWPAATVAWQNQVEAARAGMAQGLRGIPLMAPSLALPANASQVKWPSPAPFSKLNLHYYPTAAMPNFAIAQSIASLRQWGNLPVEVTEFGYNTQVVSESTQAIYTLRGILDLWLAGVEATYLYELLDDPDMIAPENSWGLVRPDGTDKPAFTALANLMGLLKRGDPLAPLAPLTVTISGPSVSSLLLQHRVNEWLLVLWQEVPVFLNGEPIPAPMVNVALALPQGASVSIYNPLAQPEPFAWHSGVARVTVSVPAWPVITRIAS